MLLRRLATGRRPKISIENKSDEKANYIVGKLSDFTNEFPISRQVIDVQLRE
jgi:hypothetical protein